ncbi:Thioredoxin domain containing protein [Cryptosporidium tyzzeri]|nr:Thioredoxin domain containing protein [Cryptosporidium tyzzeri]
MSKELLIPRERFEVTSEQKFINYAAGENFDSIKSEDWVIISGFPRHLISLIRPKLEYEIGPIDHWINGYVKEGHDVYFVSFRNNKILQKSLQFNETMVFGNLILVCPCFNNISTEISKIEEVAIPKEEYYNHSNIKIQIC